MKAMALVWLLVLTGCGGTSASTPPTASDATADTSDTNWGLDMGPDLSAACPDSFPGDGQPCTATGSCDFKDAECGGTIKASCTTGHWSVLSRPACGPYCPPRDPPDGTTCSSYPPGRVCSFWPSTDDSCTSCACTDGKWVCTVAATCPYGRLACKPGTACTANTGCGAGKCNYYCVCGADGALHCTANPC